MTISEKEFETYSMTPFGCANCGSNACIVIPLMKQLTEENEPGLLIQCHRCGEEIGMLTISIASYQMLLESELDLLKKEGQTEEKTVRIQIQNLIKSQGENGSRDGRGKYTSFSICIPRS